MSLTDQQLAIFTELVQSNINVHTELIETRPELSPDTRLRLEAERDGFLHALNLLEAAQSGDAYEFLADRIGSDRTDTGPNSTFGMFTREGNDFVAERVTALVEAILLGHYDGRAFSTGVHGAVSALYADATSRGYAEVTDTAVREVIWARLTDAADARGYVIENVDNS